MKKGPLGSGSPPSGRTGLLQEVAKYLVRGIVVGVIFEGTFLMFSFENRIIRSVTSKRLGNRLLTKRKWRCWTRKQASESARAWSPWSNRSFCETEWWPNYSRIRKKLCEITCMWNYSYHASLRGLGPIFCLFFAKFDGPFWTGRSLHSD